MTSPADWDLSTPAADLDAERSVLGSVLLRGQPALDEARDAGVVASSFYVPRHGSLFELLTRLESHGDPVDAVTVYSAAALDPSLNLDAEFLHSLAHFVPNPENVSFYARTVVERAQRRSLNQVLVQGLQRISGPSEVVEIVNAVEAGLLAAVQQRSPVWLQLGSEYDNFLETLEAVAEGRRASALSTGYLELDKLLGGGLRPGQMVVVAARPSVGKSLVAVGWSWHVATKLEQGVGLLSYEMTAHELTTRFLSLSTGVTMERMSDPRLLEPADWEKLREMREVLLRAPLWIDDSGEPNLANIRSRARSLARRHDLKLLIVDYMQLIPSDGSRAENRQVEVQNISRGLKNLAAELRVPIVALSQLNRNPEQRQDKRPALADLRESGAVENDADVVILLHRPDLAGAPGAATGEVELIVAKNRQGPRGVVHMAAQPHKARFVDMPQYSPAGEPSPPW